MTKHDGWLICSAEVAQRLGKSIDWFYRHRAELEAAGMPPPHAAFKRPLMWSRAAICEWIDGQRRRQVDEYDAAGASARMAERAKGLAGKGS